MESCVGVSFGSAVKELLRQGESWFGKFGWGKAVMERLVMLANVELVNGKAWQSGNGRYWRVKDGSGKAWQYRKVSVSCGWDWRELERQLRIV